MLIIMLEDVPDLFINQVLMLRDQDNRITKFSVLGKEDHPGRPPLLVPGTGVKHSLTLINYQKSLFFYDLPPAVTLVVLISEVHEKVNGKLCIGNLFHKSIIIQHIILFTFLFLPKVLVNLKVADNIASPAVVLVNHFRTVQALS